MGVTRVRLRVVQTFKPIYLTLAPSCNSDEVLLHDPIRINRIKIVSKSPHMLFSLQSIYKTSIYIR